MTMREDLMNKLTQHVKQIARDDIRLYLSIFEGAFHAIKAEVHRPRSTRLAQIVRDDVRLFFAPFSGAVAGIKQELQRRDASRRHRI